MALNSLKDKITSLAGNETLGLAEMTMEEEIKQTKPKKQKSKPKQKQTNKIDNSYGDVLDLLGIDKNLKIRDGFTSEDVSGIEFTPTTPVGLDVDEVGQFVFLMQNLLIQYENALVQRDHDIAVLASEVRKVEAKLIERNQNAELDMIMGEKSETDELNEQIMELVIQRDTMQRTIDDLQRKLRVVSSGNADNIEMEARIRELEEENKFLKSRNASLSAQEHEEIIEEPELPVTEPIIKKKSAQGNAFVTKSLEELMKDVDGYESDSIGEINELSEPKLPGVDREYKSADDVFDSMLQELNDDE